jgi:hypothetical protein
VKKMISLWKKQEKACEGEGVILTRRGTVNASAPTQYSITASKCHKILHRAPIRAQNCPKPRIAIQLREKKGQGQWCRAHSWTTAANYGAFSISMFYYMTEAHSSTSTFVAFFSFNPRRQLDPSSPSTLILVANFIPHPQLQPSSPLRR